MLELIRQSDRYFHFLQNLVIGDEQVNEVCQNNDMAIQSIAYKPDYCCKLVLYSCPSFDGPYCEAGIIYGPGLGNEGHYWKKFPKKMIQFFSDKSSRLFGPSKCFYLADEYYRYLVKENGFLFIKT